MKLGPVTKIDKRNTAASKKIDNNICQQIVTPLSFFQFMANLQPPESWIQNTWLIKLTFSLTITFYRTTTENRTKKPITQLSYYCFE